MPKLSRLVLALALLAGCRSPVPQDHTSLALDPGEDPGPPSRQLSMVWLHHSTGDNLLAGGLLHALQANNIDVHDINYEEAVVDGYVIGDHTDPPDFPKLFGTPRYLDHVMGWELDGKRRHDIVMFKSCYPASDIKSEQMLAQYKQWYRSLLPAFRAHPRVLFVPMSTPPRVKRKTTPGEAGRARQFAGWLTTDYAKEAPANVQVFDLFNALAIQAGRADENTLAPQFAMSATDSHPTAAGARAVTRLFVPWLNRALRSSGLVAR